MTVAIAPNVLPHDIVITDETLLVSGKTLGKDTIKEYSDDKPFTDSFRVNGGNKQFTPNTDITTLTTPNEKDFKALVAKAKEFDLYEDPSYQ